MKANVFMFNGKGVEVTTVAPWGPLANQATAKMTSVGQGVRVCVFAGFTPDGRMREGTVRV